MMKPPLSLPVGSVFTPTWFTLGNGKCSKEPLTSSKKPYIQKTGGSPDRRIVPSDRSTEGGKRFFITQARQLNLKQRKAMIEPKNQKLSVELDPNALTT